MAIEQRKSSDTLRVFVMVEKEGFVCIFCFAENIGNRRCSPSGSSMSPAYCIYGLQIPLQSGAKNQPDGWGPTLDSSVSIRTHSGVSGNTEIFPRANQVSPGHLLALLSSKAALSNPSFVKK